ncbi:hypothetical protein VTK73DRAFT_1391 [Phialemonium thermophilum]|uniref:Uncharacterized protein n=1 Tax=Phialemonium thermophilum TaxID=223376 RepID=A0ABR3VTG8_9PEZI
MMLGPLSPPTWVRAHTCLADSSRPRKASLPTSRPRSPRRCRWRPSSCATATSDGTWLDPPSSPAPGTCPRRRKGPSSKAKGGPPRRRRSGARGSCGHADPFPVAKQGRRRLQCAVLAGRERRQQEGFEHPRLLQRGHVPHGSSCDLPAALPPAPAGLPRPSHRPCCSRPRFLDGSLSGHDVEVRCADPGIQGVHYVGARGVGSQSAPKGNKASQTGRYWVGWGQTQKHMYSVAGRDTVHNRPCSMLPIGTSDWKDPRCDVHPGQGCEHVHAFHDWGVGKASRGCVVRRIHTILCACRELMQRYQGRAATGVGSVGTAPSSTAKPAAWLMEHCCEGLDLTGCPTPLAHPGRKGQQRERREKRVVRHAGE